VKKLNVILIVVESLRADQLTSYGGQRKVMPVVEALAEKSRVFRNAWSQSSHTSYAALVPLSSHYPLRSVTRYVYPEKFSYPRILVHDVLKLGGYRTGIFSSSNENWEGMVNFLQTENLDKLFHAPSANQFAVVEADDTGFATWARRTKQAGSLDDSITMEKAIEWLEKHEDGPFFVYLNLQNAHLPYRIPAGFSRRFGPETIDFKIRFGYFPRDKVNVVKDIYADSLAYVDSQIGRLVEYLTHRGIMQESVIVLTADHGQAFYEHDVMAHAGKLFEEVVRVPLIVHAPGLEPRVDHRTAQHIDIAPTILDILGLPVHPSFQGKSLLAANPDESKSVYLIAQTTLAYESAIIRSGWKLVHEMLSRRYRLHDLKNDPIEKFNLVEKEPKVFSDLANRLHSWEKMQIDYYSTTRLHTREYPPIPEY
jgi:arylsulfatase